MATGSSVRLRVVHDGEIAFGPGKAELLNRLMECRSLTEAARRMGLSYLKAWQLVRVMNTSFRSPLVRLTRGGRAGGGAEVTAEGKRVLAIYEEMERRGLAAIQSGWRRLKFRLR
jgi:molybdate transport system regulatory protein